MVRVSPVALAALNAAFCGLSEDTRLGVECVKVVRPGRALAMWLHSRDVVG